MAIDSETFRDAEDDESTPRRPPIHALLDEAIEIVANAKTMPLSSSVLLPRDDLLAILEDAVRQLPSELKEARWMLAEREEYLARVRLDADEILESARSRAESLVSKTEVVRQAQLEAGHILQRAKEESSRLRHEANDYADQKLASLEISLETTLRSVRAGRAKLAPKVTERRDQDGDAAVRQTEDAFFDQDR
ncbi:MAG: hypothetical protein ACP5PJ_02360 [Acidimicrobiales bacterium]